ncbi:MAG TPA: winged helix-turn-helix domain-containing protein [Solirubrobacterales bacterium]|nr:winged helix-turn-helix domain-containing protein [Solirubrobacterales bacterium]
MQNAQLELHKALSHELRVEILTFLVEHPKASPIEMSRVLDAPVGDVSHHVKQLVKYGCAEEVETKPRRGAVEHFYRATSRPVITSAELNKMGLPARRAFSGQIIRKLVGDLEQAFEGGTIEGRTDWHLTRVPMSLDEEGWQELLAIHQRAFEETYEVQARSDERRSKSGEEPVRFTSCQLSFELPPR